MFAASKIPLDTHIHSGQFIFLTPEETYFKQGYFDPDVMINMLREAEQNALEKGYQIS